ncbi:MAG: WD40/YVTN/BNR-like repeat-containing protein [Acidiferrobacterales bacterium]
MKPESGSLILFVGTQKGLFLARFDSKSGQWVLEGPHIPGYEILHAWLDPRDQKTAYASAYHVIWGAHIYRSDDCGNTWTALAQAPCHPIGEGEPALKAIWYLQPGHSGHPEMLYAGIDPPGLFVSDNRGETWSALPGINEHPTRNTWEPARGGFSLHSICVDPRTPERLLVAVSAGGVYRSEDGGQTWVPANRGVRAENLPQDNPETGHNVHRLIMHPLHPQRLYRQCYNGTYRSDDGGGTWVEITAGLPSDFGYAIAADPHDPDTLYQIPEESSHVRATVEGKLRVYRTRNAGRNWEALTHGLPQQHAYVSVLREAMDTDHRQPCGVYFGTSGGHLFASDDAGEHWRLLASFLPRILSVKAAIILSSDQAS